MLQQPLLGCSKGRTWGSNWSSCSETEHMFSPRGPCLREGARAALLPRLEKTRLLWSLTLQESCDGGILEETEITSVECRDAQEKSARFGRGHESVREEASLVPVQ